MSIDNQFNSVNEKLQLLLKQHSRLKKENQQLRRELEQAKHNEGLNVQKIEGLEQQVLILKRATGQMNEQDKKEFEKMINQYLGDIEKCIAYLSQ